MPKFSFFVFIAFAMCATFTYASAAPTKFILDQPNISSMDEDVIEEIQITDDLNELYDWSQGLIQMDVPFVNLNPEDQKLDQFLDDVFPEYQVLPAKQKALKRSCSALRSGGASWYGPGFHGKKTANGERFNQNDLTAAHKTIPFNSIVEVTYKNRKVRVRINDAGPYHGGRVIDLSKAAAQKLGLISAGSGRVTLKLIRCGHKA